jgi:quercetin dioxygenase-like cupin family protein
MDSEDQGQSLKDIRGRAIALAGLAEYQGDAIVSRTIIDKKIGTVTVFAFAEGQGLSEHTAPYDALVQIVDGEAEITISGRPLTARQGDLVVMPAGEPHSLRAVKRFKMLLTMIRA